jgi:hypothetical protein
MILFEKFGQRQLLNRQSERWRAGLPAASGIVLIRLPMPREAEAAAILATRIHERTDWVGPFSVIEPGRVRMRPLAKQ